MSDSSKRYTFGKSKIDDCTCPLVSAGYRVGEGCHQSVNLVAGIYDSVALDELDSEHGKLTEKQARSVWGNVIDRLEELNSRDVDELQQDKILYEQALYNAKTIAGSLGWADDLDIELTEMQSDCLV
jgi:hypothetical protein